MNTRPHFLRSYRTHPNEVVPTEPKAGSVRPKGWAVRFFYWVRRFL